MVDLLTLSEYKVYAGYDPLNTQYDAEISAMIPAASQAIGTYTGRDFGSALVTETRSFQYDGSGFLDIDDCTAVTAVSFSVPGYTDLPLDTFEWMAMPPRRDDSPVYYYLVLPYGSANGVSPEMGFTRNLDVIAREGRLRSIPPMVNVTAQWGWPTVPQDIKMATYWTVSEWRSRASSGEGLTAEAIEGFSRSWSRGATAQSEPYAIPSRARDLLANYSKINV